VGLDARSHESFCFCGSEKRESWDKKCLETEGEKEIREAGRWTLATSLWWLPQYNTNVHYTRHVHLKAV
jgi:hypothetical protein